MHRLQTLPRGCKPFPGFALPRGFKPFPAPLAYSCIAALPASGGSLGREPLERAARALQPQRLWPTPASQPQACPLIGSRPALRSACKPSPAPLAYSCTAALPSSSSRQLAGLPLLFLWASKSDVRHFAPPLNPPRGFKPFPAPLAYSCIAALPCLCVRREPGERASGTCIAALPASGGSLGREPLERAARALQPQRLWPTPASQPQACPLIGSRPALRSACKPSPAPLAYSCTAALPSSSSRQLAGLPLLFLWASKSDVRHFAPPLNPPRGFKPFPAPLAYSCIAALPCLCVRREPGERASGTCIAALPASGGSLGREPLERAARALQPQRLWPTPASQPQPCPLIGSRPALRSACKPSPAPLAYSCTAALPSSSSRQLAGLPLLFLWASKSDVRHFAPPLNPPRGFKPFPAPLAYSCIAALPCLCVRREPGERASGTCIAALPASGGSLGREPLERAARALQPQLLWPTPASQPQPCPLIGSRPALRSACKPFPAPLAYSCSAALPASGGSLGREPWNVQPVLLWASKSDVRHFAPPSNPPPRLQTLPRFCPPPRLQTLPSAFGLLLHRSLACVRREPGERASGTCSPCTAAPAPLAYSCIATAALPSYRQQACPPQRLQTLPSAFGLLLHRSLALFLFSAARRPASSLLMGFQKRR